jgi:ABC-type phosphate/phosphonate transport system permease subunit
MTRFSKPSARIIRDVIRKNDRANFVLALIRAGGLGEEIARGFAQSGDLVAQCVILDWDEGKYLPNQYA